MNINTVMHLWDDFKAVRFTSDGKTGRRFLGEPFMGWQEGTPVDEVYRWFDEKAKKIGGVDALASGSVAPERQFFVETPAGKLSVWAKHNKDCLNDYPGVYIDVIDEDGNPDSRIGNLVCCVEYDNAGGYLQIVPYADTGSDEPSFGEDGWWDTGVIRVSSVSK